MLLNHGLRVRLIVVSLIIYCPWCQLSRSGSHILWVVLSRRTQVVPTACHHLHGCIAKAFLVIGRMRMREGGWCFIALNRGGVIIILVDHLLLRREEHSRVLFNSDVGGVVETLTSVFEVLVRSHLLGPYSLLLLLLCLLVRNLKQRRKPVVSLISSMELLLLLAWNNRSLLLDRNHTVPDYANMAIFIHHVRLALESFLESSGWSSHLAWRRALQSVRLNRRLMIQSLLTAVGLSSLQQLSWNLLLLLFMKRLRNDPWSLCNRVELRYHL